MIKFKKTLILLVWTLAACSEQIAERDYAGEIEARNLAFEAAYNSGDAEGVGGLYTDDAIIMPPGAPVVRGAKASVALWQATMDSGLARLDLIDEEIIGSGNTAVNQGSFIAYDADGNQIATGKFLVFWKNIDGVWKLHHDIWNMDS